MDELESNLQTYKLQLQQVDAALTTSPQNAELLKLKTDLQEVITLTRDLIRTQMLDGRGGEEEKLDKYIPDVIKPEPPPKRDWKPGDPCLALHVTEGQYYEARIESIDGEGVSVIFAHNRLAEVTTLEFIKELPRGEGPSKMLKKPPNAKLREYQKKKKLKKQQRFKQLDDERESEKNKWLAFSTKATKKGVLKKSIFATPDNANGRVGIGTCGVSGKGMTDFSAAEKWRKT